MEEKQYKYDAFISYRHCELDKFVAENLHKALETYELPKNLKEQLNIEGRTFKRLFRDQEELPLSSNLEDPILEALQSSKYLIVICSPRLKDSLWCKKEIETFKKLRGRENIFCVLIEAEPADSFPEEVLFDEIEVVKNGKKKKEKRPVEPLAADVRGATKKDVLKKIHEEKLRLAAAMCHIDYDDLKQRHKLREQKRKANIATGIAIASILFLLYTSIMLIKINSQQNILKNHQALTLAENAEEYLLEDNRYDAIKSSYESLTRFNGVKMPYTPEGESALVESLGVYDVGSSYKVVSELKPDVVLMDLGLAGLNGIEATQKIIESSPNTSVIALTSHDREEEVMATLGAGAKGYCLKDIDPATLAGVIKNVAKGACWLDPGIAKWALNQFPRPKDPSLMAQGTFTDSRAQLTERELEVLKLLVAGKSNTEIANELIVSVHTAKAHVCSILQKLCVDDRVQAAVKAIKENII